MVRNVILPEMFYGYICQLLDTIIQQGTNKNFVLCDPVHTSIYILLFLCIGHTDLFIYIIFAEYWLGDIMQKYLKHIPLAVDKRFKISDICVSIILDYIYFHHLSFQYTDTVVKHTSAAPTNGRKCPSSVGTGSDHLS